MKINKMLIKNIFKYIISRKSRKFVNEYFSKKNIRLIMTLVVRNEEDIIETNIRFHKEMGVDGFIVSTHNSTDNTDKILEKLQKEGIVLEIIKRTSPNHQHAIWVNEMVNLAKNKYKANWVINADADEFFYSNSLNLKLSILENAHSNVLWVVSTFLFPEDRKDFMESEYFVVRPFQEFEAKKINVLHSKIYEKFIKHTGIAACPKVIHKTAGFKGVSDGNHQVFMKKSYKSHSADIRLYHYHIRSYDKLVEKVLRWENSVFLLPVDEGMHMKNLVSLYKQGKLRQEFDKQYGSEVLDFLINHGVVAKDPSVKNFLHYKNII